RGLGGLVPHSRSAVPELARALQDSYPATRTAAAATLKALAADAKSALPQIIALLKDGKDTKTEPLARVYAAQLLGRLAGEADAVVPVLAAVAGDTADNVQ